MNAAALSAPLVITSGEPAGIGPDLCVQPAVSQPEIPFVVIADINLLRQRAAQLGITLEVRDYAAGREKFDQPNTLPVMSKAGANITPGPAGCGMIGCWRI